MAFTTEEHEGASSPDEDDNAARQCEVEKDEGGGVLVPQALELSGEGAAYEEIDAMGEGIQDLDQWLRHLHLTPSKAASIRSDQINPLPCPPCLPYIYVCIHKEEPPLSSPLPILTPPFSPLHVCPPGA